MPETSTHPRILVIDERSMCEMLCFTLSEKGYTVMSATTAQEALERTRHEAPDLVIFDLKLPGADGLGILRSIKKFASDVVAIVVTASPDLQSTVESMRAGVIDYIAKPFDANDLLNAVEKALEHQRMNRVIVSAQEMNRLQSELILHMSHEFKDSLEYVQNHTAQLLQVVNDILKVPKCSRAWLPSGALDWQDILQRLARLHPPRPKAKVLVIDDDEGIVELLDFMLTREGYEVESAGDGQTALEKMKANRPDFLILDLMLPKLNGFELLEAMDRTPELRELPIVVLTARYINTEEREALKKRVRGIVQKGHTDIREIVAILNEHALSFRTLSAA